jgi:hypothetical protein
VRSHLEEILYKQGDFVKALLTAGFHPDWTVNQPGAKFFSSTVKGGSVMVSLYPGQFTASLMKSGKDGNQVVEYISGTHSQEFLNKAKQWGLQ